MLLSNFREFENSLKIDLSIPPTWTVSNLILTIEKDSHGQKVHQASMVFSLDYWLVLVLSDFLLPMLHLVWRLEPSSKASTLDEKDLELASANASHSSKSSSAASRQQEQRCTTTTTTLGFTSAFTTTTTDIKCTTTLAAAVAAVTASALRKLRQVSHQLQSFECKMHPFSNVLLFSKTRGEEPGNYWGTSFFPEKRRCLFIRRRNVSATTHYLKSPIFVSKRLIIRFTG